MRWLIVGAAGVLGSLSRYGVSLLIPNHATHLFPWATLLINLSGSLFLGWFMVLSLAYTKFPAVWRLAIGTGFTGSYTTFSTFAVDTVDLLGARHHMIAMAYVLISFVGGWLCSWMGMHMAGRAIRRT